MDGISMPRQQDLLGILVIVSVRLESTYKLQPGVLMDSTQHLLSLVSKFPSGIRGIDLRFALRMKKSEFIQLAQSSLINKTISLNDNNLSDFEEGKFKLSADLYFERAEQTPVPKIVCDLHEALQNANFPITAIHGDDDYLPLKYQKEWIPGVPSSELIVINNAGHLCWIDKPIKFEDEVRKALNKYKK